MAPSLTPAPIRALPNMERELVDEDVRIDHVKLEDVKPIIKAEQDVKPVIPGHDVKPETRQTRSSMRVKLEA